MSSSETISPTAHYTGYVWYRHGLSHSAFVTRQGRILYYGLKPVLLPLQAVAGGTLDGFLLARHRLIDHLLEQAIASGRVGQVVEIACGLSARGFRFARRHDRILYVEADLPDMAARKRSVIAASGSRSPHHRIVDLDALADEGPSSLDALAATLDPSRGVCIVTEGLLNYFAREHVLCMWQRFARVLGRFPAGLYLSDLHVGDEASGLAERVFGGMLASFVRGRLHIHFPHAAAAREALVTAGFRSAELHRPGDFDGAIGPLDRGGAARVRIIEATTA